MTTSRHKFINFLLKECSGLNYVLLNYIYEDLLEVPSEKRIEILIDKDDYSSLLYVISSAKEKGVIKSRREVRSQKINIDFSDHSSLEIKIIIDIERKGIVLMNSKEVLRSAILNKQSIKIPSPALQFEYALLSGFLNRTDIEERFRSYFSKFSFEERSKIFGHICPKYKFILNVLDELYLFSDNHYYKIIKAVKSQRQNKGLNFAKHKSIFLYDYFLSFISNSWEQLKQKESPETTHSNSAAELKSLLNRNALIRN